MTCIVKNHHLKVLFKEMQFVAFFIFHMENTWMRVKNDLRCLRQINIYTKAAIMSIGDIIFALVQYQMISLLHCYFSEANFAIESLFLTFFLFSA